MLWMASAMASICSAEKALPIGSSGIPISLATNLSTPPTALSSLERALATAVRWLAGTSVPRLRPLRDTGL